MSSMSLFAQMDSFRTGPEHVIAYVCCTSAFLFLAWLVDSRRPPGITFVLWGILLVILSCGYALIGIPTTIMATPAVQKTGVLLVLAGIAQSVFSSKPHSGTDRVSEHD